MPARRFAGCPRSPVPAPAAARPLRAPPCTLDMRELQNLLCFGGSEQNGLAGDARRLVWRWCVFSSPSPASVPGKTFS